MCYFLRDLTPAARGLRERWTAGIRGKEIRTNRRGQVSSGTRNPFVYSWLLHLPARSWSPRQRLRQCNSSFFPLFTRRTLSSNCLDAPRWKMLFNPGSIVPLSGFEPIRQSIRDSALKSGSLIAGDPSSASWRRIGGHLSQDPIPAHSRTISHPLTDSCVRDR